MTARQPRGPKKGTPKKTKVERDADTLKDFLVALSPAPVLTADVRTALGWPQWRLEDAKYLLIDQLRTNLDDFVYWRNTHSHEWGLWSSATEPNPDAHIVTSHFRDSLNRLVHQTDHLHQAVIHTKAKLPTAVSPLVDFAEYHLHQARKKLTAALVEPPSTPATPAPPGRARSRKAPTPNP